MRYAPAKESKGADPAGGDLLLRMEDGRSLRLVVPAEQTVLFASKEFRSEELEEILQRGLWVNVSWDTREVDRRKAKYLSSASLVALEVEGEVVRPGDSKDEREKDGVQLRLTRVGGDPRWPDEPKNTASAKRDEKPHPRTLLCREIPDVSRVEDEYGTAISVLDLQSGQKVRGRIVFGKILSLIEHLEVVNPEVVKQTQQGDSPQGRSEPPRKLKPRFGGG